MDTQVQLGKLHRRPIQISFRVGWDRNKRNLDQQIPIAVSNRVHLWWWARPTNVMKGQSLRPFMAQHTLFSDASKEGWGVHMGDLKASGTWPKGWKILPINWLEFEAIRRALLALKPHVLNQHVLIMCDNRTAVAYINKEGGTRSRRLFALSRSILLWCHALHIRVRCRHIAGA